MACPERETIPAQVLQDARQWADLFLAGHANPFRGARQMRQEFLLGLGTSPDKLVTTAEDDHLSDMITIHETLQDFVVTRQEAVLERGFSPSTIRTEFLPMLSTEAAEVVEGVMDDSLSQETPAEAQPDAPELLSNATIPLDALTNWFERANLVRLGDRVYIQFYKTFPGSAAGPIKPGLDWHSQAIRLRQGIER